MAMRHSVERPAISMEGGKAYGAALPAAVCEAFEKMIKVLTDLRRMFRASFDEMRPTVSNAIKLIENALKEARQGAFRVRSCRGFEKMRMPNRRRGTPPEKL